MYNCLCKVKAQNMWLCRPAFTLECGKGENPLPLNQFPEIYRDNIGILVTAAFGKKP